MSCRWFIPVAAAVLLIESCLPLRAAYADDSEVLLQRLLDDNGQATTLTTTTTTFKTGAAAARTTPRDAIRLTPDRSEIVRLDQDAASVVVTNPAHAEVMLETSRILIVMPRTPGSTSMFVLDRDGKTIYERDIIVSGAAKPYVRIRKSCNAADPTCASDSYYYCPDGCYQVNTVPPSGTIAAPPVADQSPNIDDAPVEENLGPDTQNTADPELLPVMEGATGLDAENGADDTSPPDIEETTP